jgi:hypothetical protein
VNDDYDSNCSSSSSSSSSSGSIELEVSAVGKYALWALLEIPF